MNSEHVTNFLLARTVRQPKRLRANNVAKRLKVTDREVRYLAASGKLRGFKVGKLWFFWEADVLEYEALSSHSRRHHVH